MMTSPTKGIHIALNPIRQYRALKARQSAPFVVCRADGEIMQNLPTHSTHNVQFSLLWKSKETYKKSYV